MIYNLKGCTLNSFIVLFQVVPRYSVFCAPFFNFGYVLPHPYGETSYSATHILLTTMTGDKVNHVFGRTSKELFHGKHKAGNRRGEVDGFLSVRIM